MPAVVGSLLVLSANLLAGFSFARKHRNFCDLRAELAICRASIPTGATTWLESWQPARAD
jgi:hypothetical protein